MITERYTLVENLEPNAPVNKKYSWWVVPASIEGGTTVIDPYVNNGGPSAKERVYVLRGGIEGTFYDYSDMHGEGMARVPGTFKGRVVDLYTDPIDPPNKAFFDWIAQWADNRFVDKLVSESKF